MESWRLQQAVDLAWAAGFFDGEGSISLRLTSRYQSGERKHSVTLECRVAQVDREPLEKLLELFGGRIARMSRTNPKHKPVNVWVITARHAALFLQRIKPYSARPRVRERIELAIQFQEQKKLVGQSPERFAYNEAQDRFYQAMSLLNRKGV